MNSNATDNDNSACNLFHQPVDSIKAQNSAAIGPRAFRFHPLSLQTIFGEAADYRGCHRQRCQQRQPFSSISPVYTLEPSPKASDVVVSVEQIAGIKC